MKTNWKKAFEVAIQFIKDKGLYEEYKELKPLIKQWKLKKKSKI